jgi:hypothetical protein
MSAEEAPMVRMFIHHRVEDYPRWKEGYDAFDEERRGMGLIDDGVFCGVDDANDVTVIHDFATLDEARACAESTRLREVMGEAGVLGTPEIWFTAPA